MITTKDIHGNEYEVSEKDLAWRPSTYGIVFKDNKLLMVEAFGKYHLPGGGLNLGELPTDGVVREVQEETGLIVTNPRIIDVYNSFFAFETLDKSKVLHHHSLLLYYVCDYVGGNLHDVHLDDYEIAYNLKPVWVDIDKLDQTECGTTVDWHPVVKKALAR